MELFDMLKNAKNVFIEELARSKKRVNRNDIESVNMHALKIESLLSFNAYGKLSGTLHDTFQIWLDVMNRKSSNNKAEIVLSNFLQKGKIWDTLRQSLEFAEELDIDDDINKIPKIFVNQFVYFLRKNVDSMHEEYSSIQEIPPLQHSHENVLRFIREECFSVPSIKDIPSVYEALIRLKDSLHVGSDKTFQQIQDLNNVSTCFDILEHSRSKYTDDIQELQKIKNGLSSRLEKMNANIEKSKSVYEAITHSMSDKWFEAFYPDINDSEVSRITSIDELKKFYCERINSVCDNLKIFAE